VPILGFRSAICQYQLQRYNFFSKRKKELGQKVFSHSIAHQPSARRSISREFLRLMIRSWILMLIGKILTIRISLLSIRILVISLILVTSMEMLSETTILVWIS